MCGLCEKREPLQYGREFLLRFRSSGEGVVDSSAVPPAEIIRRDHTGGQGWSSKPTGVRKRGRRGGVRQRLKRLGHRRIPLPTIMLANVQSLRNKVDELQANVKFLEEYKNACLLAITETWLKDHDSQSDLRIDGFGEPVRLDRDPTVTGKSLGGGLALYVNRSWCGNVIVRESLCAPDIELLSVSLRPFYLPREFTQLFVTLVYIHPKANVDNAVRAITRTVLQLQALSPDAPNFIMGDFNNCKPGKHLGNFHQYVTCATRLNKCLDLCYGSIKGAYKSLRRASLGASDHNTVYLVPSYKSVLKRHKPERRLVPVWTEESIGRLQDCYACTDWDLFKNSCKTVDEITETVSDYVKFCEELCIHKKSISIFPNNKPWVSKSVKNTINKRNISFNIGDMDTYKELQKQVRKEIKLAKQQYKDRVENLFSTGSARPAWEGVKSLLGTQPHKSNISLNVMSDHDLANELNIYSDRFNVHDFSNELSAFMSATPVPDSTVTVHVDQERVQRVFQRVKERKSPGPDGIGGRVLRNCAEQLAGIFSFIFSWSLQTHSVPRLWKDSIIVPVPKNKCTKTLNDFRPVALTSLVMKSFERIVKDELMNTVQANLDPLQFAYRAGRGVDDAIITLINMIVAHLEEAKSFVRLLFIDFTSAFNCIQPHILAERLLNYNIDRSLIYWLMDFLTVRSQRVRANGVLSDVLFSSTGSPQGCVLSPLLFVLYTNACRSSHEKRHIVKFADDSVIVSLLSHDDPVPGPVVEDFIQWCKSSFLTINVSKTKEMTIDFRKSRPATVPLSINDQAVESVQQYKYLGTVIDDRLSFEHQIDAVCKKANQRMYFLRKLRNINMDSKFMEMFYSCFIESVLTFAFICWFGSINLKNRNRLQGIVRVCSKIVGAPLKDISLLYKTRALNKARLVLTDPSHPLAPEFKLLPSRRRFHVPRCRTNRFKNTWVPVAIGLLNN